MQTKRISIYLILLLSLFSGLEANAQLDGLLKKAKDKAGEIIDKKVDAGSGSKSSDKFIAGDTLIFAEDFSGTKNSAQNGSFKSNGLVAVENVTGNSGKWMALQDKATYKFSKVIIYPKQFTVEFDILATGEQVKDIAPMSFGFATDNSTREYTSNVGAYTELHYYDGNQVNFGNSSPKRYVNTTFDLAGYLNRPLRVALFVDGQRMAVYLDGQKIQDGIFFNPSAAKNFYITAPWMYENGAKVLVSNIKVYGFKK